MPEDSVFSPNLASIHHSNSPAALRPQAPLPLWEHFPDELTALPQWVVWRYEYRLDKQGKAKWTKSPYQPDGRTRASTTDRATWASFEFVQTAYLSSYEVGNIPLDGVGFVLSAHDPFTAFDFDHCRNPLTGEIDPLIASYIRRLDSYTEISPSGAGIRVIVQAKLPERDRRIGNIEMYDSERFISVTGHLLTIE